MDRTALGREKIGTPIMQAFGAVTDTADQTCSDIWREPVGYYFERMVGSWLIRFIDQSLDDEQLGAVDPQAMQVLTLKLVRDMFRHNHLQLRSGEPSRDWVEVLFGASAESLGLPSTSLDDDGTPYELEDMGQLAWAEELAKPFGLMPHKLFVTHSAIVTGAREEVVRA